MLIGRASFLLWNSEFDFCSSRNRMLMLLVVFRRTARLSCAWLTPSTHPTSCASCWTWWTVAICTITSRSTASSTNKRCVSTPPKSFSVRIAPIVSPGSFFFTFSGNQPSNIIGQLVIANPYVKSSTLIKSKKSEKAKKRWRLVKKKERWKMCKSLLFCPLT